MKEKLVFGVGVTDIPVKLNGKPERTYQLWTGILRRCYSERKHKTHPSYADCSVDDRWLIYSNFKQDVQKMVGFENETWSLDKDILEKGNRVYCLEMFISQGLIRHATHEEIAACHRIDHFVDINDMGDCEILDYPEDYTSPNCKKFDERVK